MIPLSATQWQDRSWKKAIAEAIRDPRALWNILDLPLDLLSEAWSGHDQFALRVPLAYLARIRKGDPHDPLLRQIMPLGAEAVTNPLFADDPVADLQALKHPGLLHKYHGRVLIITTAACAIHCRYCFRRHFPYGDASVSDSQWSRTLDYIRADTTIHEVILSGGDPLTLSDERLAAWVEDLDAIPHLTRLRLHTRVPILIAERVNEGLLRWLRGTRLHVAMVLHANHANEIDADIHTALRALQQAGISLLNQAVLLRGVNDSVPALRALSERLFAAGVLPYYLHQLDRVNGAAHFEVPDPEAIQLHQALREQLPGYLVPRLVRELPGQPNKSDITA